MELGYDLSLPRSIIVVYLEPKENAYFNINLQLGYDVVRERMKEEMKKQVRNDIYITTQNTVWTAPLPLQEEFDIRETKW